MFPKLANDRFNEETEEVTEELGIDDEAAQEARDIHENFCISVRARWDYLGHKGRTSAEH